MRTACLLGLITAVAGLGQPAPDAGRILKQVAATYAPATDYEMVWERTEPGMKMRIQTAFQTPDDYRVE